jgi:hypothetical protein
VSEHVESQMVSAGQPNLFPAVRSEAGLNRYHAPFCRSGSVADRFLEYDPSGDNELPRSKLTGYQLEYSQQAAGNRTRVRLWRIEQELGISTHDWAAFLPLETETLEVTLGVFRELHGGLLVPDV